jgi:hypothetical protein
MVLMSDDWIDQGLRRMREREEQLRLASAQRLHHATVIKDRGTDLMRHLVAAVGAAVNDYKRRAPSGGEEIEFEALPREGFVITRTRLPRVTLECRPGYETHVLYCNRTRTEDHESAPQEFVFTLSMTVDESDAIVLGDQTRAFLNLGEVIEYLLKPVFFPTLDQGA